MTLIKKASYIPVGNNLKKAMAFAPSLDPNYFSKVKMQRPQGYINPLDTIETLQKEGWFLEGVSEQRNSDRKVELSQVRMYHPDIAMKKPGGKLEGTSNLYVSNNLRKTEMELFLGLYRLVCSNGLVRYSGDRFMVQREEDIDSTLNRVEGEANKMIQEFQELKEHELSLVIQEQLAKEALNIRFGGGAVRNIDHRQLLVARRDDDQGNNVWVNYNRMQEALIKPNMLKTKSGMNISGVYDIQANMDINTRLYEKVVKPFCLSRAGCGSVTWSRTR